MAWEEWEQLKADAAGRQQTQMQLNQLPAEGGGGGGKDLVVRDNELGKLGNMAYDLRERFRVDSDLARPSTFDASIELFNDGLDTGSALTELHDAWNSKTQTLKEACAHISNGLDFARSQHAKDDVDIETAIKSSVIESYLK
ncbi:hypothetical protein H9Y04_42210 [Streptomyces sp. TRM66268-LWL]|uniref:AG1 protein n=1 Tax=Streptomyces polyasparticus TaxID=2767826 RepID=A0ABR7SUJ6_9ACTN|nr:hypothetical protein [Streptomyces polyasparticus]MBC9719146.1 hypothetical protein [Streptomyces polyasparticus]